MNYKKCSSKTKDSNVVLRENKSCFRIENPSKHYLQKIKVDGCLIGNDEPKCDWMISAELPEKRVLYIELKGCDIDKAIIQLASTVGKTKNDYAGFKAECYAVTTRIPKQGPSMREKSLKFFRSNKATLTVKNKEICVSIKL